jgi:hypothetical protein
VSAVEAALFDFAREERTELWPRYTAHRAGVQTAEAREVMLEYAARGYLELWYAVVCESGDVVARYQHPETPPIGAEVTCERCDQPKPFTVEWDDVYLYFSPTTKLRRLAVGAEEEADPPKALGAGRTTPAPAPLRIDRAELATSTELFDAERGIVVLQAGRIAIQNLIVTENKNVGPGHQVVGNENQVITGNVSENAQVVGPRGSVKNEPPKPPATSGKKRAAAAVTYGGLVLGVAIVAVFIFLGATNRMAWPAAGPLAAVGAFVIGASALLANQLRS